MYEKRFVKWMNWKDRNEHPRIHLPGIYICATSSRNIAGDPFNWRKSIIYIGMSNSVAGMKGRLRQFDATIKQNELLGQHGGAERVRFKHRDYEKLIKKLYVAVAPFSCDVKSNKPADLKIMGKVTQFEYDCLAQYVEIHNKLPEFNDKKRSPKK